MSGCPCVVLSGLLTVPPCMCVLAASCPAAKAELAELAERVDKVWAARLEQPDPLLQGCQREEVGVVLCFVAGGMSMLRICAHAHWSSTRSHVSCAGKSASVPSRLVGVLTTTCVGFPMCWLLLTCGATDRRPPRCMDGLPDQARGREEVSCC